MAIEYKKTPELQEERSPSPPPPEPVKVEKVKEPIVEPPDLLVISKSLFVLVTYYIVIWELGSLSELFLVSLWALPFVARV